MLLPSQKLLLLLLQLAYLINYLSVTAEQLEYFFSYTLADVF